MSHYNSIQACNYTVG